MGYELAKRLRGGMEQRIRRHDSRSAFTHNDFPWAERVESYYPGIRREFEQLVPRISSITNFDNVLPGLEHGDDWKSFFLIGAGRAIHEHQQLCPDTARALQEIPSVLNAFFSIFKPGVEVRPHRGPYAGILRYHLGVIIPQGDVGIKVDGVTHRWQEGGSLLFDDSFEHEAWNKTDQLRVILFVDFIRPLPQPLDFFNRSLVNLLKASKTGRDAKQFVLDNPITSGQ